MTRTVDYQDFFREYVAAYNRSLGKSVDCDAIRSYFAESFISAGVGGIVQTGANDDSFGKTLEQGFAFYKEIGTRRMELRRTEPVVIDDEHDMVRVFYSVSYQRKSGEGLTIDFDVVYMLQRRDVGAKIFAFVAGDEMALYREHGLVTADGKPA